MIDINYIDTLSKYQLAMSDKLSAFVDEAGFDLPKAILTFYVRGERFCERMWASAVEDKVFYKILVRLKEIMGTAV